MPKAIGNKKVCSKCNRGIGQFNDDVNILKNAIRYLENTKEVCYAR